MLVLLTPGIGYALMITRNETEFLIMQTYHERRAEEAYNFLAAPFVAEFKTKYRNCKTVSDLHLLSKECWGEANYAARTINQNGYDNFTRHGTMPYDKFSALYDQARTYAIEFWKKAKRIEAGEDITLVMPHLKTNEFA